jgi:hypothetical protein
MMAQRATIRIALTALWRGDHCEASARAREALGEAQTLGAREDVSECLVICAALAADEQPQQAVRLLGAADTIRKEIGVAPVPYAVDLHEQSATTTRRQLDQRDFETHFRDGASLTDDEAIALVFEKNPAPAAVD